MSPAREIPAALISAVEIVRTLNKLVADADACRLMLTETEIGALKAVIELYQAEPERV